MAKFLGSSPPHLSYIHQLNLKYGFKSLYCPLPLLTANTERGLALCTTWKKLFTIILSNSLLQPCKGVFILIPIPQMRKLGPREVK